VEIFQHYLAVALLFGVQASELRSKLVCGHYDASQTISPLTRDLYKAVYGVIGTQFSAEKSLFWNDHEQEIDQYLAKIVADLQTGGRIIAAIKPISSLLGM
jgi:phenylalanine ammonia-lyase